MQKKFDFEFEDSDISDTQEKIKKDLAKPIILTGPSGKSAIEIYDVRTSFRDNVLRVQNDFIPEIRSPNPILENKSIKDLFIEERYNIGKIDLNDSVILPKQEKLLSSTYFPNIGVGQPKAFDFVIKAYEAMKFRINSAINEGIVYAPPIGSNINDDSGRIYELKFVKGYSDPVSEYARTNFSPIFRKLFEYFSIKSNSIKIKNFSDYINIYTSFLLTPDNTDKIRQNNYFITDYVLSSKNSPLNTGMFIEIHNPGVGAYNDVSYAIRNFYQDINFPFYQELAFSYGFIIDKNIPWRLMADISSPQMQSFIYETNPDLLSLEILDIQTILKKYYDPIDADYTYFIYEIMTSYNNFIDTYGLNFKYFEETKCHNLKPIFAKREKVLFDTLTNEETYKLISSYILLKNKFSTINFPDQQIRLLNRTALSAYKINGLDSAIRYIDSKFTFNNHYPGSLQYEKTKKLFSNQGYDISAKQEILEKYYIEAFNPI